MWCTVVLSVWKVGHFSRHFIATMQQEKKQPVPWQINWKLKVQMYVKISRLVRSHATSMWVTEHGRLDNLSFIFNFESWNQMLFVALIYISGSQAAIFSCQKSSHCFKLWFVLNFFKFTGIFFVANTVLFLLNPTSPINRGIARLFKMRRRQGGWGVSGGFSLNFWWGGLKIFSSCRGPTGTKLDGGGLRKKIRLKLELPT